jgi:hypothetical protein
MTGLTFAAFAPCLAQPFERQSAEKDQDVEYNGTRLACRRHAAGGKGGDRTRTQQPLADLPRDHSPVSGTLAAR